MNWYKRLASRMTSGLLRPRATTHEPDGGLAMVRNKPGLRPPGVVIPEIPLPDQLVIPMLDYASLPLKALIQVGEHVQTGDLLARGVLATANGRICAIEPRPVIHPSYQEALCVVIAVDTDTEVDGNDSAIGTSSVDSGQSTSTYRDESHGVSTPCIQAYQNRTLPPLEVLDAERIERACITGLGGAGFNTLSKLKAYQSAAGSAHKPTLLVNAVECEPLISCDEALILSDAASVVQAVAVMIELSGCQRCIIATEEDKVEALAALANAIALHKATGKNVVEMELITLSAVYPSGAERVLVQRITGTHIPAGTRATDMGVLCLNVATIVSAWRAQQGYPMITRIVTVAGSHAECATNVRVRIGTSIEHVLKHTGNTPDPALSRVRAGGPLSGFDLVNYSVPVTATTNCIAVEPLTDAPIVEPCIRCGLCGDVCPVNLIPQQLYWHATGDDIKGAMHFGLDSCIECGCCDVVCPSSIPLTSTFRYARTSWREQQHLIADATLARDRYGQRKVRLQIRQRQAQTIREQKKAQLATAHDPIAAALARARARKKKP